MRHVGLCAESALALEMLCVERCKVGFQVGSKSRIASSWSASCCVEVETGKLQRQLKLASATGGGFRMKGAVRAIITKNRIGNLVQKCKVRSICRAANTLPNLCESTQINAYSL